MKKLYADLLFAPTYAWNVLLGRILKRRRWWDYVDPMVILGARPLKRDLGRLYAEGVRGVVNMCQEYPGPVTQYKELGIDQLWLPTIDFQPPSIEHIAQGVEYLHRKTEAGEKVYVHCKAGRARSATVVICWLVQYRGLTLEEAQQHLLDCRPHVHPKLGDRLVVQQYIEQIKARAAELAKENEKSLSAAGQDGGT